MAHGAPPPDEQVTVLRGGTVWLGPGTRTHALAMRGPTVVALGDDALALAASGSVVDLGGGLLLPGFSDGHCHPPQGGLELAGPLISGLTSVDAIVAEVGRFAAAHPELAWIKGGSYDATLVEGGRFDAAWLDAVVPDRPVMLRAQDYHTLWCSSLALARAGVTAATPDPALGRIDRNPDGSPLGTLREWQACDLVLDVAPPWTLEQQTDALAAACASMNAFGVTWMQDAWVEAGGHLPYLELLRRGDLTVRADLAWLARPETWREDLPTALRQRAEVDAAGAPRILTARTVKLFADGVIESGTADMLEPYLGTHDHGMAVWAPGELAAAVAHVDSLGFQVHLHAIGDAAVRRSLDAIEHAVTVNGPRDRRPVITHVQLVDPADLPRFAALGVVASVQSFWAQQDEVMVALTAPRLGPDRTARQYPIRTLHDLGGAIATASDWPVSTNDPLEAVVVAATRQTPAGEPAGGWVPHERLPFELGLRAATAGGAFQGFTDMFRGSLAVGAEADLVWYDRDVTAGPDLAARDAVVRGTWLAGRQVYAR
ncbi:MAG: amidohydrolase family protein [Cellulomonadaceae bacterium]|nr:amidohydrolase family protein [Cellulomonadaceae bacterium]